MPRTTRPWCGHLVLAIGFLIGTASAVTSHTYVIAPDGDDGNDGTLDSPFGTFQHAIGLAAAGDTLLVRGGVYMPETSVVIDRAGACGRPIRLWAYDETPVLDFTNNPRHADPPQPRDDDTAAATSDAVGIYIANGGDWWHIRGLTIRNAPYYGVRVYGSHNVLERLVLTDNQASGLEITGKEGWTPSHNLVLDCDSFLNFDPQTNGEDADGFAAKFETLGPGNVFRGLRAWSNSDDGYDFWHAAHPVLIERCWAFDNGFFRPEWEDEVEGSWRGDGLGFKLGQDAAELRLHHDVAFGNKAFGVDANGNGSPDGVTIHNATLVNNAKDGNPVQLRLTDGRPHTVRNTIAFDVDGAGVTDLDAPVDDAFNTWNGIGVSPADFVSLDMTQLYADATAPRGPGGRLPDIGLHLDPSSHLIDAGVDVGLPYDGTAPDLGAFEADGVSVTTPAGPDGITAEAATLRACPNPLTSRTALRVRVVVPAVVRIAILDTAGRRVRTFPGRELSPGSHAIRWDGRDDRGDPVASGVYWVRAEPGGRPVTEKILVLR